MCTKCGFSPCAHNESFLEHSSGVDEIDIAIMQLINLGNDDIGLAFEACEFIAASVSDAKNRLTPRALDIQPLDA